MVGHCLQLQREKNGLPKIDKIPATYSAGDFYLQVAMQLQKELAIWWGLWDMSMGWVVLLESYI